MFIHPRPQYLIQGHALAARIPQDDAGTMRKLERFAVDCPATLGEEVARLF